MHGFACALLRMPYYESIFHQSMSFIVINVNMRWPGHTTLVKPDRRAGILVATAGTRSLPALVPGRPLCAPEVCAWYLQNKHCGQLHLYLGALKNFVPLA